MLRSAVGQTSDELNEVSVSSQRAEHLQASDSSHSAEQPSLEVNTSSQTQAKELSLTGCHSTTYQISSAHHVQGEHLRH